MNKLLFKLTLCSLIFLIGCGQTEKKQGLIIVNVLDADHFNDCHIKGSINVSLEQLDDFAKDLDKQKAEVVFYCSNYMCTASGFSAKKLKDMGFEHVWAYEAGIADWYQKGLPTEGPCEKPYLTKQMNHEELDQSNDISIISTEDLAKKMHL
jgi:rhodanese-related sulfurtransferase